MTISKKRFEQLIIDAAMEVTCNNPQVPAFAHALIRRVEAESKVVGQAYVGYLVAMPLVAED